MLGLSVLYNKFYSCFCFVFFLPHSSPQTTRLVLPGMLKRYANDRVARWGEFPAEWLILSWLPPCRRTGLIINISSQMGIHPQPLLALYSATKARCIVGLVWHQLSFLCVCFKLICDFLFSFFFFGRRLWCISLSVCMLSTRQRGLQSRWAQFKKNK